MSMSETQTRGRGRPASGGRKASHEFRTRVTPTKGAILRGLVAELKLQSPEWMSMADGDVLIAALEHFLMRQNKSNSGMPKHITDIEKEFQS
jgi:hypothetical protein